MSIVWFNISPGTSGGPSVWVARMTKELQKRGHRVIFDKPHKADVAVCVISVGKTLKKINRNKTKVILRVNGIYNDEYNKLFNRAIRPDMVALHNDLRTSIPRVDHVVYQSEFSRDRIFDEIIKHDKNYSVINNGADPKLFQPANKKDDGFINLFTLGKLRDDYLMESLIGTYQEVKKRGHRVRLVIAGDMDAACVKIYSQHKGDADIIKLGAFPNTKISRAFAHASIFIAPRMGSSCDQVITESLTHSIPVVVPAWGGNAELITDGVEGSIVDSGGHWNYGKDYIQKLADGVEQIIPDLAGFKARARKHAVAELTVEKMVDRYLKAMGV